MAILNFRHLLEQAERLLEPRGSGTVVRQADRRRAISAAYYAVFHAILTELADEFVGRSQRKTLRYALAYRNLEHKQLEALSNQAIKQTPEKKFRPFFPDGGFDETIREFASLAVDLKDKRNSADYDPLHWVQKADAMAAIASARKAIERFAAAPADQKQLFLALLAFPPR